MLCSSSWQGNIWFDYDRWQLGIKDIVNILYLKIKDSQSDLAMCLRKKTIGSFIILSAM